MCGIVGYAGRGGEFTANLMMEMRDSMQHRGPDDSGIWSSTDGTAILAHRRLAILDLSAAGAQPMQSPRTGAVLVFNGEIYNFDELRRELSNFGVKFSGHGDTEVLLAAYDQWGESCVEKLRGMFAFAIFDQKRRTLFIARDRAGEKPLYWAFFRGGVVFASELKALLCDSRFPRCLSAEGLSHYLCFGYVPGSSCILEGVHKLMPAHSLSWRLGDDSPPNIRRYWDLPANQPDLSLEVEGLTDQLDQLLSSAVQEQMVADVPLAVLLSGGIDSSIITAVAARSSRQPVRTFTVTLPGHPQLDESLFARKVAKYLHTEHVELPLDQLPVDIINKLAAQYDEPIADSSMIPTYLLAKTVGRHCKVVLGGDGGDELFGGYPAYQAVLRRNRLTRAIPHRVRTLVSAAARNCLAGGTRGRNLLLSLEGSMAEGIAQAAVWIDSSDIGDLSPWLAKRSLHREPKRWRADLIEADRGLPGAAMAADFRSYLPEDILVKVDRASMLASLEVRAPFLDRRVVEFACGRVPNQLRVTQRERKILLKALARRLLPPDLDLDRKQGFSIPISRWLTDEVLGDWKSDCREQIRAVFCERAVSRLIRHRHRVTAQHVLFGLVLLTSWMRQYRIVT